MFWKAVALLFRLLGLLEWAKGAWDKHEAWKLKQNDRTILTDSDADVDKQLRDKYTRQ